MRTLCIVATTGVHQNDELRARADRIVDELARVTAAWHDGCAPSVDELYALVDDLGALRSVLGPAGAAAARPAGI